MHESIPLLTQKEIYKELLSESELKAGTEAYLISRQWISKFQDDVGYTAGTPKEKSTCGPIDNSDLLFLGNLNPEIHERIDYEVLTKDVWDILYKWYGGGPILKYPVIQTKFGPKVILKPLTLLCYYKFEEPESIQVHQYMKVKLLKEKAMKKFHVSSDVTSRLWDYSHENFQNLMQDDCLLNHYNLEDNQEIFLDTKKINKWDKDLMNSDSLVIESLYEKIQNELDNGSEIELEKKVMIKSLKLFEKIDSSANSNSIPGIVGLYNFNNVTSFNAVLQCLLHHPIFMHYFLSPGFHCEKQGPVVEEFSKLMKQVWSAGCPAIIAPSDLMYVISTISSRFRIPEYENAIDFLIFFLSIIHDELDKGNKLINKNKFMNESQLSDEFLAKKNWGEFIHSKKSFIIDNFYGQIKCTYQCSKCGSSTTDFDVYNILQLPISEPTNDIKLKFIPIQYTDEYIDIVLTISKQYSFDEISQIISTKINRKVKVFVCSFSATVPKNNGFQWGFPSNPYDKNSQIFAFEYDESNKFFVLCLLKLKEIQTVLELNSNYSNKLILLGFDQPNITEEDISVKASLYFECLWKPYHGRHNDFGNNQNPHNYLYIEPGLFQNQTHSIVAQFPLDLNNEKIAKLSIDPNIPFLSDSIVHLFFNPSFLPPGNTNFSFDALFCHNCELKQKEEIEFVRPVSTVYDSIEKFLTITNDLNSMECPTCKTYVFPKKKIDLWSIPKSLIICLGKFTRYSKLDVFVKYPLELDLSKYVIGPHNSKKQLKYKLQAVILHTRDLAQGQYSSLINVIPPNQIQGKWYHFDNSKITECDEDEIIDRRAYILFYQKIESH